MNSTRWQKNIYRSWYTILKHIHKRSQCLLLSLLLQGVSIPVDRSFSNSLEKKYNELTPDRVFIVFPTRPISDLRFQMPKKAWKNLVWAWYSMSYYRTRYAAFSKRSSPVNRLSVANSRIKDPAPATPNCHLHLIILIQPFKGTADIHVSRVSPLTTPCRRLILDKKVKFELKMYNWSLNGIYPGIWKSCRCIESRQQPLSKVVCKLQ